MKSVAFFNPMGGVGKTTLVYHLAWMFAANEMRVLAVDLDPQAELTSLFLDEDVLDTLWTDETVRGSIVTSLSNALGESNDADGLTLREIDSNLHLLPGHLGLSQFEELLSESWSRCLEGDIEAFRATTALYHVIHRAALAVEANIVLVDTGPNLGAINRAALLASDFLVIPVTQGGAMSQQALRILGPTLDFWRNGWRPRVDSIRGIDDFPLPAGGFTPMGYILMHHQARRNLPTWGPLTRESRISEAYQKNVLRMDTITPRLGNDPNRIGAVKSYRGLIQLANDARKPVFKLTAADGVMGAHAAAASKYYLDFKTLSNEILERLGVTVP